MFMLKLAASNEIETCFLFFFVKTELIKHIKGISKNGPEKLKTVNLARY